MPVVRRAMLAVARTAVRAMLLLMRLARTARHSLRKSRSGGKTHARAKYRGNDSTLLHINTSSTIHDWPIKKSSGNVNLRDESEEVTVRGASGPSRVIV
jgi:hypothetical protein